MESRTNRGLTAGVLCNVQRHFNGLEPLSDNVTDGNVVHAMFAFQIYKNGFHGGTKQASAVYRHFCRLKPSEIPLKQNGLAKTLGAAPRSLQACYKKQHAHNNSHEADFQVIKQARRLICNHPLLNGKSL